MHFTIMLLYVLCNLMSNKDLSMSINEFNLASNNKFSKKKRSSDL